MSRITLAPNVSGTGTLTVAAPNTNTDRTLTLPDLTGTAVVNQGSGAFVINSSENVGIGTSSPLSKLEVNGGAANTYVRIVDTRATYPTYIGAEQGSTTFGRWGLGESMRIDSSGNVFMATTTSFPGSGNTAVGFMYEATGTFFVSRASGVAANFNRNDNGTLVSFRRSGTEVGTISVTTTATAYNTSSDYRLKENVQPMTGALDTIAQLNPVTYNWKSDGSDGQGFIAHELQAVVPDCVSGEKDAVDAEGNPRYQGVDTSFLVATLVKGMQEQQQMIQALQADIAALKGV